MTDPAPFDPGLEAVLILERALATAYRRRRRWPNDERIARDVATYEYIRDAVQKQRAHEPLPAEIDDTE